MSAARWTSRTVRKALTIGAFAAALAGAAPATAATTAPHNAPTMLAGEVIVCSEVSAELPTVFGRDCSTGTWGPLSDFTIVDRGTRAAYRCATGWAEGSLWVNGQGCRRIPTP
ncbi:hypothetical protein [Nonomuraea sp. NPDC046570]|uniref:hypothetical protein n=1 Tax=Nonomuraea sp. NPDC046570 TaxID=3155255 RepID=UPI0033FEAF47